MRKRIEERTRLIFSVLLALVFTAYLSTAHAETAASISKVNGGIELDADERAGRVHTVNGSIRLKTGAEAGEVSTVNGGIYLDEHVRVDSASTVNGSIRVADSVVVNGDLTTVNGAIRIQEGSLVASDIRTVNGTIDLSTVTVNGNLSTRNGDILILDGSTIEGDIIVEGERRRFWLLNINLFGEDKPRVEIDADSTVKGSIHLYREVDLRLHGREDELEIVRHY